MYAYSHMYAHAHAHAHAHTHTHTHTHTVEEKTSNTSNTLDQIYAGAKRTCGERTNARVHSTIAKGTP